MRFAPPEFARGVLDAAPDAMIIIDAAGVVRYANQQLSTLFGYEHSEVVSQPVELLMPERFRERHLLHRQEYRQSGRIRPMGVGLELFGRHKDGREFPVEISLSPIGDDDSRMVAAAIRDVTERKRVEAELIEARALAERARESAVQAREAADRASQAKSRFLATASHDLRQPLQALALLNGALRRVATDPTIGDALAEQDKAINTMSRLIGALLDISKLESGAIRPSIRDFSLATVFRDLQQQFDSIAQSKALALNVDISDESAHSDPALIEQILRNLLSNAIKYTASGSVSLQCLAQDDGALRIEVSDTGIGIAPEQLAHIYDEFYQVAVPGNTSRDGYGLGLSIVQRLVKLLGLELDVRSAPGEGSCFALHVPQGLGTEGLAGSAQERLRLGKRQVLLVETDRSVRDATRLLLRAEGYRVLAAATLAEALQQAQANRRIDLLVTDQHLADGATGPQVISVLRERLGAPVKAVLITGEGAEGVARPPGDPHLRITSKAARAEEFLALLRALLAA